MFNQCKLRISQDFNGSNRWVEVALSSDHKRTGGYVYSGWNGLRENVSHTELRK